MTAVRTLDKPKAKRLSDKPSPQKLAEPDEPKAPLDERTRRCLDIDERDILEGQSVYPPLTLKEIVAICKEARAERYAEEQSLANHR
ncbi:MAG: molybdenum cofactor biosynthesis protein MoaE [Planctomycetaceae bacterium]|nr:molybdenum cofactor biosynthesis protein MoaE [Planctomycetaceae bacterium]